MNQHQLNRRHLLLGAAASASGILLPGLSFAQGDKWPQRPVRLIAGFAAGSSPDLLARALTDPLSAALGQPVIVENKVGAGGAVGAEYLAKANDGHTFGVVGNGAVTSALTLNPKLGYTQADLIPITTIVKSPMIVVASSSINFRDSADFFKQARAAGNKWSYGSMGIGTAAHLGMELIKSKANFDAVHVPYNTAPNVLNAIISGDIHLASLPIGSSMAMVQAGRVKAVAVSSATQTRLAPGVPSLLESGIEGLNVEIWNAIMAPINTPAPILQAFSREVIKVIQSEEVTKRLIAQGWEPGGESPEAFAQRVRSDTEMYRNIIQQRKITIAS